MDPETVALLETCRQVITRQQALLDHLFEALREEHDLTALAVAAVNEIHTKYIASQSLVVQLGNQVLGRDQDGGFEGEMGSE